MSFLGSHFNFDGVNSKDFGLKIVSINVNLTDIPSGSGYEYQSVSAIRNPRKLFLGLKEATALEFPLEIVSENPIDLPTFLRIKHWLFGNFGYQKLQIESEWYEDPLRVKTHPPYTVRSECQRSAYYRCHRQSNSVKPWLA